ncbi:sigma-70 family RNA polymerase sigma factor [Agromyces sp. CFH 90414]|uniref:Sigma-70 family RNA polymerase sigma factor n=1 Tax=Agromyces agglutinans TaxID=2662258 RepID=A0A6I2F7E0_9MICO|nr:sigma-70 family RNA polymerase sigma factor [Agromyces agglutinans]
MSPADDAADCLGEILLVLWRRRDALPQAIEERRAWTFGIANRVLKSYRRGSIRRIALMSRLRDEIPVSNSFSPSSDDSAVIDVFARLRHSNREVIALAVWKGFSLAEAPSILGAHNPESLESAIRADAARARYSRARRRVRLTVEGHDE